MKAALFSMLIVLSTVALHAVEKRPFDLTTLMGETYHGCRIIKVTPAALTIVYDSGISKIPFELLGDSWREIYHYDPDKAREFAEREEQKRLQADAKRKEMLQAATKGQNQQMNDLLKAARQREDLENRLAKEQAEGPAKPATPPTLAPFPGDPPAQQGATAPQTSAPGSTIIIDGSHNPPGYTTGNPFGNVPGYIYPPTYIYPPAYVFPAQPRMPFRTGGRRPGMQGRMYQR